VCLVAFVSGFGDGQSSRADPLGTTNTQSSCAPFFGATATKCVPVCTTYIFNGIRQGLAMVYEMEGDEADAIRSWLAGTSCWQLETRRIVRGSEIASSSAPFAVETTLSDLPIYTSENFLPGQLSGTTAPDITAGINTTVQR
jgi:hypothetical protein